MTAKDYNNPANWFNAEDTMKKFGAGETTLSEWVKANPKILRYVPGKNKRVSSNGRTVRRFPMYNVALILEEIFITV